MSDLDKSEKPLILFDGVCNLCNSWVRFVLKRDSSAEIRFGALQSQSAKDVLIKLGLEDKTLDSILYVEHGEVFRESDAIIKILQRLGGVWSLFRLMKIVPKPVRDAVYRLVAKNRYRIFGKKDSCMIPSVEQRSRFLP